MPEIEEDYIVELSRRIDKLYELNDEKVKATQWPQRPKVEFIGAEEIPKQPKLDRLYPEDDDIDWFRYGYPLPRVLELDDFGVPVHPFWRHIYYERLLDPKSPAPHYTYVPKLDLIPFPVNDDLEYYFICCHYYQLMEIDLRKYKTERSLSWFSIPFPGPDIIPYAEDGMPEHVFWLAWYLVRQKKPFYPIPPYDKKGELIFRNKINHYQIFSQVERKTVKQAVNQENSDLIENEVIRDIINQLYYPYYKESDLLSYDDIRNRTPGLDVPLCPPTVPQLARAYIQTQLRGSHGKNNAKLDPVVFPDGFTERHRKLLYLTAGPSILKKLQENLPTDDPLIQELLQVFKKKLPNSEYEIL